MQSNSCIIILLVVLLGMKRTKDDFFEHIDNKDIKTIEAYHHRVGYFEKLCIEKFGKIDILDDFSDKHDQVDIFQKFVNYDGKTHSPSSVWNTSSSVRKYTYYRGWQLVRGDLADLIELPTKPEKELYGITISDIHKILAELNFDDKLLHCFNAVAGTRIGESVQLRKKHFHTDKERIMVKIPSNIAKFKRARTTFVTKEIGSVLGSKLRRIDDNDLVFGTSDFGIKDDRKIIARAIHTSESSKGNTIRGILKKTGLDFKYEDTERNMINTHSFRAYFITKMSRHDENLAKLFAGEKGYLLQYDRLSDDEKLEKYLEAESDLSIFDLTKKDNEIKKLKKQIQN